MGKPDSSDSSKEYSATDALKNFHANARRLTALLAQIYPSEVLRSVASLQRIEKQIKLPSLNVKKPEGLLRAISKVTESVEKYVQARELAYEWMSVMLVTFLETYLEESLVSLALKNPNLLRDATPMACHRVVEANSIEELHSEVRQQWSRTVLRPGGPEKWMRRLRGLGADKDCDKSTQSLQHLWDTRNLIVHAQSVVSPEYDRKYQTATFKVGERLKIGSHQFKVWTRAVGEFTESIDRFFASYGGSRRSA
jgi:hypothetical protein